MIFRSIYQHAELIFIGEEYFLEMERGNHQSLRGLVLLLAGCYFSKKNFIKKGIEICNFHFKNDFLADGTLCKNSPSYHVFETWHMRNAYLLSQKYKIKLLADIPKRLKKATNFIKVFRKPNGFSPVINDGYSINLNPFLETLSFIKSLKRNSAKSFFFKNAGMGIYKNNKRYFLLDASPYTGSDSHYHAGKNAFTYWWKG